MRRHLFLLAVCLVVTVSYAQVDTSFVYNPNTPYGSLDIRIAKSPTRYYYLQEDVTFSFRESSPGVKTNTFYDMTAWDSSPYGQGNLREKNGDSDIFIMNYRLLKPEGYDPSYAKGYPLIIMFHGSGEKANCWNGNCYHATPEYSPVVNDPPAPTDQNSELLNNDHSLLHGGKIYLDAVRRAGTKKPDDPGLAARAFPGFVLFPQNLNGWTINSVQDALKLLRLIIKKYNIDEDRIYINGISNGGHGVYQAIKRAPWLFAASITMSAVDDASITSANLQPTVDHIPMWVVQGALDVQPYPTKTRKWVKLLRDAGTVVRYTEYPDLAHTTWNRAYAEPDFFTWMLGANKGSVHVFAGNPAICKAGGSGVPLQLPEGFLAYQWEFNGKIINGANAATYMATSEGKYRARFSRESTSPAENQWNEWSPVVDITIQEQPVAEIEQIGTVLLKDLNGGVNATLQAKGNFAHYYWYKDGVLMDLPGSQDDTLRSITITPGACNGTCTGNGVYTLVTSNYDNCNSAPSQAKYVYLNDLAPVNITAPSNFSGQKESASSIKLQWTDNAANEIGYEVWRRKRTNESAFTPWQMATLTPVNTSSFTDTGLEPSTTYQYKIRAVGTAGRSDYTPSGTNTLEVSTGTDEQAPVAPAELSAKRTGLDAFLLTWNKSSDDSGVRNYRLEYNGQTIDNLMDTAYTLAPLAIDSSYVITVKAVDLAGNVSDASNALTLVTNITGLFYQHTPGYWPSLDSIDWSHVENSGFVDNFTLSPKTQEDYFNFRFDGFVYITTPGSYQFRTSSDDGSRLKIDGNLLVDNNGIHELTTVESAAISLNEGAHRISVDFFDYAQADTLIVEYKGPDSDNQWAVIPSEALRSNVVIGTDPNISNAVIVNVFPNPTDQNNIQVQIESLYNDPIELKLLDPVGRSIFDMGLSADEARYGVRLPIQGKINAGMYIIHVKQKNRILKQKVLIMD